MKLQKFENVDVIASLEAIMKQNTAFYQSDFDIDKQILQKAAVSPVPEDKRLLWFSRPSGTCCFRERDVFLKDTRQHNTWRFYGEQTRDTILAYAVELTGTQQEKIKGNLYELDYLQHFREVIEKSIPADNYTLIYEHGELTKPAGQYFDGDTDPQLGKFIRFEAQPNDPEALKSLLREQQKKRTPHTQRDFQLHIAALHTSFWAIHFCVPVMGALLFLAYYSQYASTEDSKKLKMILEITTTFFPLLISVIVGLNVALEEKASHFQTLLAVPNRHKNMLAKLTYLYSSGVFALFFLFLLFVIGIHLLGMADTVQLGMLIGAAAGMVFCNLIIYILHLFLSFKFGLGLSLFWGVFESLQCILYSNIELKGVARYIPFAWSMNWVQDILSRQIFNYGTEKIWIAALTTGGLLLTLLWFSHWEGRKNYE